MSLAFWRGHGRRNHQTGGSILRDHEEDIESDVEEETSNLLITRVDDHCDENRKNHHTDEYEKTDLLVLRRGQPATFTVFCNRDPGAGEEIWFRISHGKNPKLSQGTLVEVTSSQKREVDGEWWLEKVNSEYGKLTFNLHIPANAPVARYNLAVTSWVNEDGRYVKKSRWPKEDKIKRPIVILFNSWCPNDQVYLANEAERDEYVLNDHGRVWVGSPMSSRPWYFAQFEEECYEVALDILSFIGNFENRSSAVLICRNLSHLVSSHILQGQWFTPYAPYHSPTDWTGSLNILKSFKKQLNCVKFGQCWVFSAVTTTLCRCLGIPCRSVTNFQSAHDTDRSVTIDYHFDQDGKPLDELDSDSVWNFHVWNEACMKRPDLPGGYDGWQAFDATPQETSEIGGQYACGPCPLQAIKEGNLHIPYDGKFIFSEVNGDKCYWRRNARGKFDLVRVEHSGIGTSILTKAVGRGNRTGDDLRSSYKHPDDSSAEKEVMHRAYGHSSRRSKIMAALVNNKDLVEGVQYSFIITPGDSIKAGTTVVATLSINNGSSKTLDLQITMTVGAFYYYGRPMSKSCKTFKGNVQLLSGEVKELSLPLEPSDYLCFVKEDAQLRFSCMAESADGDIGASFVDSKQINLDLPEIEIKTIDSSIVVAGEPLNLELSFTNPLDHQLTDIEFTVEGAGMRQKSIKPGKDLGIGQTLAMTIETRPRRKGQREIVAAFRSEELTSMANSVEINVI